MGTTLTIRLSHIIGKEGSKRELKSSNAPTEIKADYIADKNYAI